MKVRFKELTEAEYNQRVNRGEIRDEALYFIIDRGALYKGRMLIADNTENNWTVTCLMKELKGQQMFIDILLSQDPGGLLLELNHILKIIGYPARLIYEDGKGFHLE